MVLLFKLTVTSRGVERSIAQFKRMPKKVFDAMAMALDQEMELIAREARDFYVPVDTGVLRNTIQKQKMRKTRNTAEVSVVAGPGGAESHALAVHEHPSGHSPRSWRGKSVSQIHSTATRESWSLGPQQRGPKFLSRPLDLSISRGRFLFRIVSAMQKAVDSLRL